MCQFAWEHEWCSVWHTRKRNIRKPSTCFLALHAGWLVKESRAKHWSCWSSQPYINIYLKKFIYVSEQLVKIRLHKPDYINYSYISLCLDWKLLEYSDQIQRGRQIFFTMEQIQVPNHRGCYDYRESSLNFPLLERIGKKYINLYRKGNTNNITSQKTKFQGLSESSKSAEWASKSTWTPEPCNPPSRAALGSPTPTREPKSCPSNRQTSGQPPIVPTSCQPSSLWPPGCAQQLFVSEKQKFCSEINLFVFYSSPTTNCFSITLWISSYYSSLCSFSSFPLEGRRGRKALCLLLRVIHKKGIHIPQCKV